MQFHAITERPSAIPRPGVSWLLFGFVVLSLTVHALLFISGAKDERLNIVQLGTPYIHVTLANTKPATRHTEEITPKKITASPAIATSSAPLPAATTMTVQKPIALVARTPVPRPEDTPQNAPSREPQQRPTAPASEPAHAIANNIEKYRAARTAPLAENTSASEASNEHQSRSTAGTEKNTSVQHEALHNYLLGELRDQLSRHLIYPQRARRRGWEGEVLFKLDISTQGRLENIQLLHSSGYASLDRSAINSLSRVGKLRLPSTTTLQQTVNLQLPVIYRLSRD